MTTSTITSVPSVEFWPPVVEPKVGGLFPQVIWPAEEAVTNADLSNVVQPNPDRFIIGGVHVRTINYGGQNSSGVWDAPWCGAPTPSNATLNGSRPAFPAPFEAIHCWAFDSCDETEQSRDYVRLNAQRWLEQNEQNDVETSFAARMLTDAGTPQTSTSFLDALGKLEVAIGNTNLPGFIHISPYLAPFAVSHFSVLGNQPTGEGVLKTWLESVLIFGSGYSGSLGMTMIATSQVYGWRGAMSVTDAMYAPEDGTVTENQFVAVAERSYALGYEKLIAAVTVTLP